MTAVEVSYTEDGPADAPVVVLSNSLGATRGMWDPQVPALAERYRVVSYDTRGHGDSPSPAGPYTLDDLVDDVVALLDRLGVRRAHLVGHSFGANVALQVAVAASDRVAGLVLIEPLLGFLLTPDTANGITASAATAVCLPLSNRSKTSSESTVLSLDASSTDALSSRIDTTKT